MAYKDKTTWQGFVNSNVNTNGTQAITGAILNEALIDLSDSVNWGIAQQGKGETLTTSPAAITFAVAFPSANYQLQIRSFDAVGDPLDYNISNITSTTFTITGVASGFFDWYATHP